MHILVWVHAYTLQPSSLLSTSQIDFINNFDFQPIYQNLLIGVLFPCSVFGLFNVPAKWYEIILVMQLHFYFLSSKNTSTISNWFWMTLYVRYAWILLVVFQLLMTNVSLLGHLCGILSGFACMFTHSFPRSTNTFPTLYAHIPLRTMMFG